MSDFYQIKWKSLRKCSTVCFLIRIKSHRPKFCKFCMPLKTNKNQADLSARKKQWGYNQLQNCLRHCTISWLKEPGHDLVLVIPPLASNTRPGQNLEEQLWMQGRSKVSITLHRSVTSSDLKWVSQHFCNWSVSTHSSGYSFIPIHPCAVFVTCHIRVSFILFTKNYNCLLSFRFIFYFTN